MDLRTLVKNDLNLLVVLWVLYEERSVSRAAERLFVTQSAVSKSLGRLRQLFDDSLFTRSGHGLIATPFLDNLAPRLATLLNDANQLLEPSDFDPEVTRAQIRVALPQDIELVVMPRLVAYLQKRAPGIAVICEKHGTDILQRLAAGELDLAVTLEYMNYPAEYRVTPFLASAPILFARKDHPIEGQVRSVKELCAFPLLNLKKPDEALIKVYQDIYDRRREIGFEWDVAFETDNLITALSIVRMTDSLLPVPDVLTKMIVARPELKVFKLAEYLDESLEFVVISHTRTDQSAMHQWFTSLIMKIGEEIRGN